MKKTTTTTTFKWMNEPICVLSFLKMWMNRRREVIGIILRKKHKWQNKKKKCACTSILHRYANELKTFFFFYISFSFRFNGKEFILYLYTQCFEYVWCFALETYLVFFRHQVTTIIIIMLLFFFLFMHFLCSVWICEFNQCKVICLS